jgi:Rrf2 family protein
MAIFSKATEYALRATIYIAQKSSEEKKIGINEISKAIDSPKSFTAKILQTLTKDNKIISSISGPNGGFYMNDKAKALPLRTLLEVIGDEDVFNNCIMGLKDCSEKKPCPLHSQYKPIKEQLKLLFEQKTLGELAMDMIGNHTFIRN